jgi:hypothetical protein
MRINFHAKLAIGILLVFGLFIGGYHAYRPLLFIWYKYQIQSGDPATRENTAEAIAEKGRVAMPYVKKWLDSGEESLVVGACSVLRKMKGGMWEEALPELKKVLRGRPSAKTNAAAAVIIDKEYLSYFDKEEWIYFETEPRIKRNICIQILLEPAKDDENYYKYQALSTLGELGDKLAVKTLVIMLENDSNEDIRKLSASALGDIGDTIAVDTLIKALLNDECEYVRSNSATALGKIHAPHAVEPLAVVLDNDLDEFTRVEAAKALGQIGDARSIEILIDTLTNDNDDAVRAFSAIPLAITGNPIVISPLTRGMNNDNDGSVRFWAAVSLSCFDNTKVMEALENANDDYGKTGVYIALAWLCGEKYIELLKEEELINSKGFENYLICPQARWGDASSIGKIISTLMDDSYTCGMEIYDYYKSDIFSRMPEGFPKYDFKAKYRVRKKQAKAIEEWYEKNKDRLAWDAEKRRYYLK